MTDPETEFLDSVKKAAARGRSGRGFLKSWEDARSGQKIHGWLYKQAVGPERIDGERKEQSTWFYVVGVNGDLWYIRETTYENKKYLQGRNPYSERTSYWIEEDGARPVSIQPLSMSLAVGEKGRPFSESKALIDRLNY